MKIIILSDSHGDSATMCDVIDKERPGMIIYLGDGIADTEALNVSFPNIELIKNLGNVDSHTIDENWIKITEICGKRFLMTHGHTFFTERDFTQTGMAEARSNILKYMGINNIDITLHGHIHEPFLCRCQMESSRRRWIMCPGRIGRNTSKETKIPTYGALVIRLTGELEWKLIEVC